MTEGRDPTEPTHTSPADPGKADRGGPLVHVVRGDDPALVAQAAHELVSSLVGDEPAALVVEEHGPEVELEVGAVVDACATPPMLTRRRVVVVREAGRLSAADAERLAVVVEHPLEGVHLVLVEGGGTLPAALVKRCASAGEVVEASAGRGRARSEWIAEHLARSPVRLEAAAVRRLEEHMGEDVGRLAGLMESLEAAFGSGARVSAAELEPFLGEAGTVPPWELTDAIDAGEVARALEVLGRLMAAGGRSAPYVVGVLDTHFSTMLRLDGAGVRNGEEAAAFLGVRSAYAAGKALAASRRLGSERIGRAIALLAGADVDAKGRSGLEPELIVEILVARLASLGGGSPAHAPRGGPAGSRVGGGVRRRAWRGGA